MVLSLVLTAAALLLVVPWGCKPETRYRVLSNLFDGVPPPGSITPTRRPVRHRRVLAGRRLLRSPTATPTVVSVTPGPTQGPVELASRRGWEAVDKLLPRSIAGGPDWVAALAQGMIAPRAAIEPGTEAPEPFDHDVVLDPGVPGMKVIFPHKAHTQWLGCQNCHPGIFQMEAGADHITMDEIFAGKWCGTCHGPVAFPPTGCPRCHVDLRG